MTGNYLKNQKKCEATRNGPSHFYQQNIYLSKANIFREAGYFRASAIRSATCLVNVSGSLIGLPSANSDWSSNRCA